MVAEPVMVMMWIKPTTKAKMMTTTKAVADVVMMMSTLVESMVTSFKTPVTSEPASKSSVMTSIKAVMANALILSFQLKN